MSGAGLALWGRGTDGGNVAWELLSKESCGHGTGFALTIFVLSKKVY
jgi:hypothetical protein